MIHSLKSYTWFILIIASISVVHAQNDTIYYNKSWKPVTVKDSASFFRIPVTKNGELFHMQDFYLSGKRQMEGFSLSAEKDIWQGKVTWYNEDGSVYQEGDYEQGYLEGDFITYLKGNKLKAKYSKGQFISGKRNTSYGDRMYYMEKAGDTIKEIVYQDDIDGIRFERIGTKDIYELSSKYYGEGGTYIGEKTTSANGNIKGEEVTYMYGPMRVKNINYYSRGTVLGQTFYYPNGKLRSFFQKEPDLAHIYYTPEGEEMGRINYKMDAYGIIPNNGTLINFAYGNYKDNYENEYKIARKTTYTDGKISEDADYYLNGQVKAINKFKDGQKILQVSYTEDGSELAKMEYENYKPMNGTEINSLGQRTYENGELIKEIIFFYKTDIVQIEKTNEIEIYYDKEGNKLGELALENSNSYPKPLEGKRYTYDYNDGSVSGIEEYENGGLIRKTYWRKRKINEDSSAVFKRIEEYDGEGYYKTKEIKFYSNGKKQSETLYKKYVESTGTFYSKTEEVLGSFDYIKKEGTRYKFFGDSDAVQEYEVIKDGEQIAFKKYDYGNDAKYGNINPVLVENMDVNCCASFYDRDGKLIAEVKFKNQKPWSGEYYDPISRELFQIKEGKKSGDYKKLDYSKNLLAEGTYKNDKKEGVFKTFTYKGGLLSKEIYQNDKLNGKATYYDQDGEQIGEMLYKDGMPMDGVRTSVSSYKNTIQTYKGGQLLKEDIKTKEGLLVKSYSKDGIVSCKKYFPNEEKIKYSFELWQGQLNGDIVKYDVDGKELARAVFDKGRLVSGTVYLKQGYNDKNLAYYSLNKKGDALLLSIYGEDDKLLFSSEERLYFGEHTFFSQKLGLEMKYFNEGILY